MREIASPESSGSSQLRCSPSGSPAALAGCRHSPATWRYMVRILGFEPRPYGLEDRHAANALDPHNQIAAIPLLRLFGMCAHFRATACLVPPDTTCTVLRALQVRDVALYTSRALMVPRLGIEPRPGDYRSPALPDELSRRGFLDGSSRTRVRTYLPQLVVWRAAFRSSS